MSSQQELLVEKIKSAMIKAPSSSQDVGNEASFANMPALKLTEEESTAAQSESTFWEWLMKGEWWFNQ